MTSQEENLITSVQETPEEEVIIITAEEETEKKLHKFPLGRVKNVMKCDPDVNALSSDSVFLIAKATELFVESLARESFYYTNNSKKKTVSKNDVDKAINNVEALAFLEGAIED